MSTTDDNTVNTEHDVINNNTLSIVQTEQHGDTNDNKDVSMTTDDNNNTTHDNSNIELQQQFNDNTTLPPPPTTEQQNDEHSDIQQNNIQSTANVTTTLSPSINIPQSFHLSPALNNQLHDIDQHHHSIQPYQLEQSVVDNLTTEQQNKLQQLNNILQYNKEYQDYIHNLLDQITIQLNEIHEKRRLFQLISNKLMNRYAITKQQATRDNVYNGLWFVDNNNNKPDDNIETIRKYKYIHRDKHTIESVKWTDHEKQLLKQGVIDQCRNEYIRQEVNQNIHNNNNINTSILISNIEQQAHTLNEHALLQYTDVIDWDIISNKYVQTHTSHDCRVEWLFVDDPRINQHEFNVDENNNLNTIAQYHCEHDWISIAKELNTNRTPLQCLQQYQQHNHPLIGTNKWSQQDEKQLILLVQQYGEHDWYYLTQQLLGRSPVHVKKRWIRSVSPNIINGAWHREEDIRLKLAIKAYGSDSNLWVSVSRHVPGRTDVKCRERWMNVLRPEVVKRKWTKHEDDKLLSLVQQYGINNNWPIISQHLVNRKPDQCFLRWCHIGDKKLVRQHIDYIQSIGIQLPLSVKRGPYKKTIIKKQIQQQQALLQAQQEQLQRADDTESDDERQNERQTQRKKRRYKKRQKKNKQDNVNDNINENQDSNQQNDQHNQHDNNQQQHQRQSSPQTDHMSSLPVLPSLANNNNNIDNNIHQPISMFPTFGLLNQQNNNNNQQVPPPPPPVFYTLQPPSQQQNNSHQQQQHINNDNNINNELTESPTLPPLSLHHSAE